MLLSAAAFDDQLVAELTALINRVYENAEAGIWMDGAARTTHAEVADLVAAGEIAVARDWAGVLVGSVRIQRLGDGLGEFGMLVAAPDRRGTGIGRELVRFAERRGAENGAHTMQLELLVPRDWTHPAKKFLDEWYTRIGYRVVRRGALEDDYPHLAPLLATPCDFMIYHKPLPERHSVFGD
ncbi:MULTISPECIES: GNAT family N-acetyltransferase [unclassified Nocardia]|uniref:GNAT family N-acetyltransferase n=1 Tax=unclassified Nocardia TaxID=2637762 RepID=UPI001CE48D38|nr:MULTISPECIES: GNAT family N-acetyltransferase [unclassified Nocardia]